MNSLGTRIRQARGNMSQEAFAAQIHVSKGSLGFYERDQNLPNTDVILKICSVTNVSLEWLLRGVAPPGAEEMPKDKTELFMKATACSCAEDLITIPRVMARLCPPMGSLETDGNIQGVYAFRADWILHKGNTEKMVLMNVTGDSMSPEIKHGDVVLIDQGKTKLYGYGFYAVALGEEVYVKQVKSTLNDLVLHSTNPHYEDIVVNRHDKSAERLRIIGRVVWIGRELA